MEAGSEDDEAAEEAAGSIEAEAAPSMSKMMMRAKKKCARDSLTEEAVREAVEAPWAGRFVLRYPHTSPAFSLSPRARGFDAAELELGDLHEWRRRPRAHAVVAR